MVEQRQLSYIKQIDRVQAAWEKRYRSLISQWKEAQLLWKDEKTFLEDERDALEEEFKRLAIEKAKKEAMLSKAQEKIEALQKSTDDSVESAEPTRAFASVAAQTDFSDMETTNNREARDDEIEAKKDEEELEELRSTVAKISMEKHKLEEKLGALTHELESLRDHMSTMGIASTQFSGWLIDELGKKMWGELRGRNLLLQLRKPVGKNQISRTTAGMNVRKCNIVTNDKGCSFSIIHPDGRANQFTCHKEKDLHDWVTALKNVSWYGNSAQELRAKILASLDSDKAADVDDLLQLYSLIWATTRKNSTDSAQEEPPPEVTLRKVLEAKKPGKKATTRKSHTRKDRLRKLKSKHKLLKQWNASLMMNAAPRSEDTLDVQESDSIVQSSSEASSRESPP